MNTLLTQLALLQVIAPLALILINASVPVCSWISFISRTTAIGLVLVVIALAGVWLFPPWWTPCLIGVVHAGTSIMLFIRWRKKNTCCGSVRTSIDILVGLILLVGSIYLVFPAIQGRGNPQQMVNLAPPLQSGRYLVTSGGTTEAINSHLKTLTSDKFRGYRGQSYAIDVIEIDQFGFRASGISPLDPSDYYIYGADILAPCGGVVRESFDGVPDNQVPEMNREHMLGNHVILECQGFVTVIAHMAESTVAVEPGDEVQIGAYLGKVGNSGNSAETHLHIHVQKSLPEDIPMSGEPVWFSIDSQFLVRNDQLVIP